MKYGTTLCSLGLVLLACSSTPLLAQPGGGLMGGDRSDTRSSKADSPKCGVDIVCLPESVKQQKKREIEFRDQRRELERQLALSSLKNQIEKQKRQASDQGDDGPPRVRSMPNVPNPGGIDTSGSSSPAMRSSSLDEVRLTAVYNDRKATFSVRGRRQDAFVGDQISGYELQSLDFDTARLTAPGKAPRTLHVNW